MYRTCERAVSEESVYTLYYTSHISVYLTVFCHWFNPLKRYLCLIGIISNFFLRPNQWWSDSCSLHTSMSRQRWFRSWFEDMEWRSKTCAPSTSVLRPVRIDTLFNSDPSLKIKTGFDFLFVSLGMRNFMFSTPFPLRTSCKDLLISWSLINSIKRNIMKIFNK